MKFITSNISNPGKQSLNQDAIAFRDYNDSMRDVTGCWILADGLGGHGGGREAAQLAVDTVLDIHNKMAMGLKKEMLQMCFERAQEVIMDTQDQSEHFKAMRTTLVVLLARENQALWAHVGDSRLYHFQTRPTTSRSYIRTKDHSVPQVLVDAGDIPSMEIRYHEDRNRLLRSLGSADNPFPDVLQEPVYIQPGDAFLLCSDGFWEYVTELEMETDLSKSSSPEKWLELMSLRLTKKSYTNPDADNFSAIGIFVVE